MEKKAFGTYEIAEICHVTPSTVGNWIEKGLLPTFTTGGGHRRVWSLDLAQFLEKHNIPVPEKMKIIASMKFLIVDDEDQVRRVIKRTLQKLYPESEIYEALDGFEAGQKVSQLVPSLIVLDLKLPGVDGLKVCRSIRSDDRLKKMKVLAISGQDIEESKKNAFNAGADDFLGKPFDVNEFRNKISKMIEN